MSVQLQRIAFMGWNSDEKIPTVNIPFMHSTASAIWATTNKSIPVIKLYPKSIIFARKYSSPNTTKVDNHQMACNVFCTANCSDSNQHKVDTKSINRNIGHTWRRSHFGPIRSERKERGPSPLVPGIRSPIKASVWWYYFSVGKRCTPLRTIKRHKPQPAQLASYFHILIPFISINFSSSFDRRSWTRARKGWACSPAVNKQKIDKTVPRRRRLKLTLTRGKNIDSISGEHLTLTQHFSCGRKCVGKKPSDIPFINWGNRRRWKQSRWGQATARECKDKST